MDEIIREKGFALIEILVVMMIIGILAAVTTPMCIEQTIKAKLAEVTNALRYVITTLDIYHHTHFNIVTKKDPF